MSSLPHCSSDMLSPLRCFIASDSVKENKFFKTPAGSTSSLGGSMGNGGNKKEARGSAPNLFRGW